MLLSTVLEIGLVVLSYLLLRMRRFRLNLILLVAMAVAGAAMLLMPHAGEGRSYGANLFFLLVVCAWEHYWTQKQVVGVGASEEQAWKHHKWLAVILTAVTALAYLNVPVFSLLNQELCLTLTAVLWCYYVFNSGSKPPSQDIPF